MCFVSGVYKTRENLNLGYVIFCVSGSKHKGTRTRYCQYIKVLIMHACKILTFLMFLFYVLRPTLIMSLIRFLTCLCNNIIRETNQTRQHSYQNVNISVLCIRSQTATKGYLDKHCKSFEAPCDAAQAIKSMSQPWGSGSKDKHTEFPRKVASDPTLISCSGSDRLVVFKSWIYIAVKGFH